MFAVRKAGGAGASSCSTATDPPLVSRRCSPTLLRIFPPAAAVGGGSGVEERGCVWLVAVRGGGGEAGRKERGGEGT